MFVFIQIPGCLPNEYKYLNHSNYSNNGYSNENFSVNGDNSPQFQAELGYNKSQQYFPESLLLKSLEAVSKFSIL